MRGLNVFATKTWQTDKFSFGDFLPGGFQNQNDDYHLVFFFLCDDIIIGECDRN